MPRKPSGWTLPLAAFPASFRDDVQAWLARLAGRDSLAEDGPDRPLRAASVQTRPMEIRMAASALVLAGTPVEQIRGLADLVQPEPFRAVLRQLLERYGRPTPGLHHLGVALKAVAQHHAKLPQKEMDQLRKLCRLVQVRHTGLTRKNRDRLRPFDDPVLRDRLVTLPAELMRRADRPGHHPRKAALDAQRAAALEILLMAPLRMANLAALRLGTHVLFSGRGRDERAVLVVPAEEVKNGVDLEFPLPPESARLIRRYADRFLPTLAA